MCTCSSSTIPVPIFWALIASVHTSTYICKHECHEQHTACLNIHLAPQSEQSHSVSPLLKAEVSGDAVQAFVSVNWLLSEEHIDLETELAWGFLDYLMLGTTAAPLRRALTESGLGESIIGGGLSDELRQPTFSLGLKGVDPANAQKVCLLQPRLWFLTD